MREINLEPSSHTTLIEVQPAAKWVLPLTFAVWLLIGWAAIGFGDWFPYAYSFVGGGVMLAAVASYPKFFLAKDR